MKHRIHQEYKIIKQLSIHDQNTATTNIMVFSASRFNTYRQGMTRHVHSIDIYPQKTL